MSEIWKDVIGFPGYMVSNYGRVKNSSGHILAIRNIPNGYKMTMMSVNGQKKYKYTHRIVARAFIGEHPGDKCFINHIGGDKSNNHFSNLEWVTRSENMFHAVKIGLLKTVGENHHKAKINKSDVLEIRNLYKEGKTQQHIANLFGIGQVQVGRIVNRKRWAHVL